MGGSSVYGGKLTRVHCWVVASTLFGYDKTKKLYMCMQVPSVVSGTNQGSSAPHAHSLCQPHWL